MAVEPAQPGWYEDPSGEPGLFAYWDGSRWGDRTRDVPERQALPLQAPRPAGAHNSRVGWILALAFALFAVAVLAVIASR